MGLFPPAPGGGAEVEHGYKGKGSLLHLLTDFNGRPLAITTTPANGDERQEVKNLLNRVENVMSNEKLRKRAMVVLEADKGYDSDKIRQMLLNRGLFPFIPRRRMGNKVNLDRPDQRLVSEFFKIETVRWKVERSFAWLKRKSRRLLMRWERLSSAWMPLQHLLSLIFGKKFYLDKFIVHLFGQFP